MLWDDFGKEFADGKEFRPTKQDDKAVRTMTLEHLGTEKEETVVFEDSALTIETACKAGFPTVGIYDRFNYGQDIIKKLADVYIDKDETLMKCFE